MKVAGRKTSVSLEEPFWQALREIATARGLTVRALIGLVDEKREQGNLSSALRVFVLALPRRPPEGNEGVKRARAALQRASPSMPANAQAHLRAALGHAEALPISRTPTSEVSDAGV